MTIPYTTPLFIIGAGRSGTTFVSRVLERSPDIYNGHEFRYIWNYRAPSRHIDLRGPEPETAASVRYIRRFFTKLGNREHKIILDKTPSNAWRIPFILSVFPDARFIHVIRDGRANIFSRYREWQGGKWAASLSRRTGRKKADGKADTLGILRARWRLLMARYRIGAYPPRRLPAILADNAWPLLSRILFKRPIHFGEHVSGLTQIRQQRGILIAAAYQWRDSVCAAVHEGRRLNSGRYL